MLAFVLGFAIGNANGADRRIERLLDSIEDVETGGMTDEQKKNAVGDDGKSRGPYQISYAYWLDATAKHPSPGTWREYRRDSAGRETSRKCVLAYFGKYGKAHVRSGHVENLARLHNGGPSGHRKAVTKSYWNRVKIIMEKTMDTRTGEIFTGKVLRELLAQNPEKAPDFVMLENKARPSCRYCHGRGYEFQTTDGAGNQRFIPCRCTLAKR